MMSRGWRQLAAVVAFALVLGLLSACGQQQPDKTADVKANEQSIATAADGQETPAARHESEASTTVSPIQADSASEGPVDQPTPSPSPSGQIDSVTAMSPDQPISPSPSPSPDLSATSSSLPGKPGSASAVPSGTPSAPATSSPSASSSHAGSLDQTKESEAITFSIVGNAEWGTVIEPESLSFKPNDTVGELLIRTLKKHKLAYETRGAGAFFYVTGIDGLFEFDDGPTSGWKFRVNGTVVGTSAGDYKLDAGDRVEWFYASSDEESDGGGDKP